MPDNNKKVNGIVSNIQNIFKGLYKGTYNNTYDNRNLLNKTMTDIDRSIDKLLNKMDTNSGNTGISALYSRLYDAQSLKDDKMRKRIEDLFNDTSMMDGLFSLVNQNTYIRDQDLEIDTICKYMPQLLEALECKKDNVLCADSFKKDYINVTKTSELNKEAFDTKINELKTIHNLLEFTEEVYDRTSKYGEAFIYCIPYTKAFELIDKNAVNGTIKFENGYYINENGDMSVIDKNIIADKNESYSDLDFEIDLSKGTIVSEANLRARKWSVEDPLIPDDLEVEFDKDLYGNDGLTDLNKQSKKSDKYKYNVIGSYVKLLERANVLPIYIDDICLGYYYFENYDAPIYETLQSSNDPTMSLTRNRQLLDARESKRDALLKNISMKLAGEINAKFINNNQDLRKEIYIILKHNYINNEGGGVNKFKITYIPPDDIIHSYFKKDPVTHRGISDLAKALFPAKLYVCMYITNAIAHLTRGQDKRAYYIKQNVDTNISMMLLNTINQIKKSNFGLREINSLSNILNLTGKFNDYVIPTNSSGDAPIQFEVIPGQDIPLKTELMDTLESMAVNSTDVPLDMIQNRRSVDFATRLSMTSAKFERVTAKRQLQFQKILSRLITKLFNHQYDTMLQLEVILPPPSYLAIQNTLSFIQNAGDYIANLTDAIYTQDADQNEKDMFRGRALEMMVGTHINMEAFRKLQDEIKLEMSLKKSADEEEGNY